MISIQKRRPDLPNRGGHPRNAATAKRLLIALARNASGRASPSEDPARLGLSRS